MSNITTDFITAVKKLHDEVRTVLSTIRKIQSDTHSISEHLVEQANKPIASKQEADSDSKPSPGVIADTNKTKGQKDDAEGQQSGRSRQLNKWIKSIRKPRFQLEIAAIIGLLWYTCETKRTNDLTEQSVNLQFSLNRSFVQITATDFVKWKIEDIEKAGFFPIELQNVGKSTATKVHGVFSVEVPKSLQEPSLDLTRQDGTTVTQSPLYPGGPPASVELIFIHEYGSVPNIPVTVIDDLEHGSRYAVIFGRIEYEDSFGYWWTQFCGWRDYMTKTDKPQIIGFAAKRCVDFNIEGGTPKKR